MKNLILIVALAIMSCTLTAQDDRIEGLKKDFITKELELTSQEADAFFPIYNEYSQKRKEARKSLHREMKSLNSESNGSVDKIMDKEQDMVDIQKEYLDRMRKVIPERKVIKLIEAEKKFKMMLIQKLKG